MLKKRLIGVVTVRQGWAVQSFGYSRYLPLGRPEVLVENLDRWGADEILVQCIDRSRDGLGPDFDVIRKISRLGISTPLIYAGGIRHREDAVQVVSFGADRVMVDALLTAAPEQVEALARDLGTQAVIGHLPLRSGAAGAQWLDHVQRSELPLADALSRMPLDWISELMLSDWHHEGMADSFDEQLPDALFAVGKPLLCFGGISNALQVRRLLARPAVVACGVGNFLSYREHAIQALKSGIGGTPVRAAHFQRGA